MSELRVTQAALETASRGEKLRASGVVLEAISIEGAEDGILRSTLTALEVIGVAGSNFPLAVTHNSLEVLYPSLEGFPPTISVELSGEIVELLSSPFDLLGQTHEESRWQVALNADTGFSAPVVDLTSDDALTYLLLAALDAGTAYRARVLHVGNAGQTAFSLPVVFTTLGEPVSRPNPPVLSIGTVFSSGAQVVTTPFSHPDGQTTEEDFNEDSPLPFPSGFIYEVIEEGGDWNDPIIGPVESESAKNTLQFVFPGNAETTYLVRARWLDGRDAVLSLFSNILSVTLPEAGDPVPPANPVLDFFDGGVCIDREMGIPDTKGYWYAIFGRSICGGGGSADVGGLDSKWCVQSFDPEAEIVISIWPRGGSDEQCSPGERLRGPHRTSCHEPSPTQVTFYTRPHAFQPFLRTPPGDPLAKAPGAVVDDVFRIHFEGGRYTNYLASLSSDDGVTFGDLPPGTVFEAGYVEIDPSEMSSGWHIVRIGTSLTVNNGGIKTGAGWNLYFPFRVAEPGEDVEVTVLDFKSMAAMPAEAERLWDDREKIEWGFRPGRGITAKAGPGPVRAVESGLVFPSIGRPRVFDGVVTFSKVPRLSEDVGFVNRFASNPFMEPGVLLMANGVGSREVSEERQEWRGVSMYHRSSWSAWAFGACATGSSNHIGDSIAANAQTNGVRIPNGQRPLRYGIGETLRGRINFKREGAGNRSVLGPLPGRQGYNVLENRTYGLAQYTMRFRVEITDTHAVVSLQNLGPELEEGVWSYQDVAIPLVNPIRPEEFMDCGLCGLYLGGSLLAQPNNYADGEVQFHSLAIHSYGDDCDEDPIPPPPVVTDEPAFCVVDRYYYLGPANDDGLKLYQDVHVDEEDPIRAVFQTREVAPFGVGEEALFTDVYLTIQAWTSGAAILTPIIDGDLKLDAQRIITWESDGTSQFSRRYELALYEHLEVGSVEVGRKGLRGTFFRLRVELIDTEGVGKVSLGGFELQAEPATLTDPEQLFIREGTVPRERGIGRQVFMFGQANGNELRRYGNANRDVGQSIPLYLRSRPAAPLGPGGEAIFTMLSIPFYRDNAEDVLLTVTPIVDGRRYPEMTITLEGVPEPVREVRHLHLFRNLVEEVEE